MTRETTKNPKYRVYFMEGPMKFYLVDIIAHDDLEHPQFSVERKNAMVFRAVDNAVKYGKRLRMMGYQVHIE